MGTLMATRLKQKRLDFKLSQKELAAGICEQGQISRIEKGNYTPGSDLLYALAKRLQVPMEYFYDEDSGELPSNLNRFKQLAQELLAKRDYANLAYIYDTEVLRQHQLPLDDQLYLDWISSILLVHLDKKLIDGISLLETVIKRSNQTHLQYLIFLNSLLSFYYLAEDKPNIDRLTTQLLELVTDYPIRGFDELDAVLKIRYNHARRLWLDKRFEEGLTETLQAIELCNRYNSRLFLADLYCLLGNLTADYTSHDKAKDYYHYAQVLARLNGNEQMAIVLQKYIDDSYPAPSS